MDRSSATAIPSRLICNIGLQSHAPAPVATPTKITTRLVNTQTRARGGDHTGTPLQLNMLSRTSLPRSWTQWPSVSQPNSRGYTGLGWTSSTLLPQRCVVKGTRRRTALSWNNWNSTLKKLRLLSSSSPHWALSNANAEFHALSLTKTMRLR